MRAGSTRLKGRGRGRPAKGHVRIADNSYVYALSHTVHLQCTALQDVTFVRHRLRLEMVYDFSRKTGHRERGGWAGILGPRAACRDEWGRSFGVVAQGLFADAKGNDPFVDFGDTELLHLRCF